MSNLFKSRKFLVLLVDAVFGIGALLVAYFVATDLVAQALVLGIFAIVQPVFIGAINAIANEDIAAYAVGSHPNQL